MEPKLKILILEDNPVDEELTRRELSKAGLVFTSRHARVKEEFLRGLKEFAPDLVLLDYSMPGFGGMLGLKAVQENAPEVPCIVVTGSLDEETAVGCIKAGAYDYVLKQNLVRLPPAVRGAVENRRIAQEARLAQEQLAMINDCLLSFGPDSVENINSLTALCGELVRADCALYNRIDERLWSAVGQWHPPPDFNPIDKPDERICREVVRSDVGHLFVARELGRSLYSHSPEARHGFGTYVGLAVKHGGTPIGSLCALYRRDFQPRETQERAMSLVAAAVGIEEQRLQAEKVRERLSEELRQSQKMEAVGRLAGGVAHDFNNALTAIKGHCELLLMDLPKDTRASQDLLEIDKASDYAASLTRQLLAFSRKQILSPKVLNIDAAVKNVSTLLRRTLGENVEFKTKLGAGASRVKADPGQLEQILMNLSINARDAMPEGGRLTLETREADMPEGLSDAPILGERFVMLRVSDTGTGMDAAALEHIFEPFFTTKETGKGTGLGLSTVYGIVKQSGGEIEVESRPGQGTVFAIYLPAVSESADRPQDTSRESETMRGDETILLVEDEATVRALCTRILRRSGYEVLEASSAEKALEYSERQDESISLMVTDLVMPGMNGRQLAERLCKRRPDLKVLYISGYADETIVKHGLLESGTDLLQKPFNPMELCRRVRRMLDS
ncbi:MAG: response regulator [Elusimicrobia bacterium]|nr:response regulator [Elusimicrobiota bacterium]